MYLKTPWNQFDTSLVLIGAMDFIVYVIPAASFRVARLMQLRRLFRLLRVLRVLRVFRNFTALVHLILVLKTSRQGLWHVGTVVFFVFYIYAYLGVLAFGKVGSPFRLLLSGQ
jgi:hypothetical protein